MATKMSKKQLEDLFIKTQRPKIPIPITRTKVSKPIPLPRPKKHTSSPRPITLQRTKKPVSSLGTESNIIEDYIIKDERNLFRLKKENEVIKGRIIRDIKIFSNEIEKIIMKQ